MTRIAIYARVSTKDRQEATNQLNQLRQYAQTQGFTIHHEYVDHESGRTNQRTNFQELFLHAHQRKFDTVLFWSLDRFSREGTTATLNHLQRLEDANIGFVSFTEPYLSNMGHFRDAIIGILASLAKQESVRLGERVKAGMARARRDGVKLGRPRVERKIVVDIRKLLHANVPKREIARQLGVSPRTVRRYAL